MQRPGTSTVELDLPSRVRPWTLTAAATVGWALFTLTILHVVSSYDPAVDTLSRYAFTDYGAGMLEAGLISLAIGVFAVGGALRAASVPFGRTTSILFTATAMGLVTAALFPASFGTEISLTSGRVHQLASLVAFLSLPGIALTLLEQLRQLPALASTRNMLRQAGVLSLGALGLFGISYVTQKFPGNPVADALTTALPVGLTQRLALVADFALVLVLLMLAVRAARSSSPVQ